MNFDNFDHQAKKRFGQNFLHDQNIIDKIIKTFNPKKSDVILEIGPGLGALTGKILDLKNLVDHLYLVEIDRDLAAKLQKLYTDRITLFNYDILKFDLQTILQDSNSLDNKIKIIGNLPYNISTPILFHLFKQINNIQEMLFMLQLEVVDRMIATSDSDNIKDYGRLSVMTQFYCTVEKIFTIPPNAFIPAPKVKSAIVRLTPKVIDPSVNTELLSNIVRDAFNQRRKTITNSLRNYVNVDLLKTLNIDPRARAENLNLEQYVAISRLLVQLRTG